MCSYPECDVYCWEAEPTGTLDGLEDRLAGDVGKAGALLELVLTWNGVGRVLVQLGRLSLVAFPASQRHYCS